MARQTVLRLMPRAQEIPCFQTSARPPDYASILHGGEQVLHPIVELTGRCPSDDVEPVDIVDGLDALPPSRFIAGTICTRLALCYATTDG
jgi:hypothetical protein